MSARQASPFSRGAVLGIVVVGFVAFVAMLYFISVGDTGGDENNGGAHAASNGLTGYSALTRLLKANDYDVVLSREESNLETYGLLVLTPPAGADEDELSTILRNRAYTGPTLVIVPKWYTSRFPQNLDPEIAEKLKDGWVQINGSDVPLWLENLDDPYAIKAEVNKKKGGKRTWAGFESRGELPRSEIAGARNAADKRSLITDSSGRALAVSFANSDEEGYDVEPELVTFLIEPDFANNYGMNDPANAAVALRLVEQAADGSDHPIIFDLTANGLGSSVNLLTLAFRPPFLAATLCLIIAMLIVGWRAFKRFGPAVAEAPVTAFGKSRLVANGAGLIVRAGRLRLLAEPYADLSARRIAGALGLAKPDPEAIDAAIQRRLPNEEPYSNRAARLRAANTPTDILRAAQALKELEGKLSK